MHAGRWGASINWPAISGWTSDWLNGIGLPPDAIFLRCVDLIQGDSAR
jgi:hypothetical protein